MREIAYPILRMTLDHDENFGGGGLQGREATGAAGLVSGRLDGKVVLVTGTGGGIGRATALVCAREGAHVVGCDLHPGPSQETVELVRAAGGRMDAVAPVDLSTEDGARDWVERGGRARPAGSTCWSTTPRPSGSARSTSCPTRTGRSPSATSWTSSSW